MNDHGAYVGPDVHKDAIAVAVAPPGRDEPVYRGEIKNQYLCTEVTIDSKSIIRVPS